MFFQKVFFRKKKSSLKGRKINRIIIRMPNWLGDFVLATSLLSDIRQKYPDAYIVVMCKDPLGTLLQHDPSLDEIFSFQKPNNWKEFFRLIKKIRAYSFDLGILLTHSFSSALLFFLSSIPLRLGYSLHGRKILLRPALPLSKKKRHQIFIYKKILEPLGIFYSAHLPSLVVTEEEKKKALDHLQSLGFSNDNKIVAIHMGAAYGSAKCYPQDRFPEIIKKLLKEKIVFLFIGDVSLEEMTEKVVQNFPKEKILNLTGKTNLRELAAYLSFASVLLTNDSGPMHLAAALQRPIVSIFGSTDPNQTGPFPQGIVIRKKVACSPCFKRVCPKDFRCMKKIENQEIVRAIRKYL